MSDSAAILATFHDWRTVKGRKQLQLIFEVDLERQEEVLTRLGAPMPSSPMWVAIALLDKKLLEGQGANAPVSSKPVPTKDRRRFEDLALSQQSALRCEDRAFRRFLAETIDKRIIDPDHYSAEDAADTVRAHCGVSSRSLLDSVPLARAAWLDLDSRYTAWKLVA